MDVNLLVWGAGQVLGPGGSVGRGTPPRLQYVAHASPTLALRNGGNVPNFQNCSAHPVRVENTGLCIQERGCFSIWGRKRSLGLTRGRLLLRPNTLSRLCSTFRQTGLPPHTLSVSWQLPTPSALPWLLVKHHPLCHPPLWKLFFWASGLSVISFRS